MLRFHYYSVSSIFYFQWDFFSDQWYGGLLSCQLRRARTGFPRSTFLPSSRLAWLPKSFDVRFRRWKWSPNHLTLCAWRERRGLWNPVAAPSCCNSSAGSPGWPEGSIRAHGSCSSPLIPFSSSQFWAWCVVKARTPSVSELWGDDRGASLPSRFPAQPPKF